MPARRLFCLACALSALAANAAGLPETYRDDAIVVRAGIPEAGTVPLHVGDVLTLALQVDFDPRTVQLEALDEVFFQRAFADRDAFRLLAPPVLASEDRPDGRQRIEALWRFRILDCPDGQESCPGSKRYELPTLSLNYRLSGAAGDAPGTRAARFHPRPERLVLAPATGAGEEPDPGLEAYFPGGAWPPPAVPEHGGWAAPAAAVAGGLLLAAGLAPGRRGAGRRARNEAARAAAHGSRWARLHARLGELECPDDHWADHLRRCITWYCQDELAVNPCRWLADGYPAGDEVPARHAVWRELWLEILELESIPERQRPALLARVARLAGLSPMGRP